MMHLLTHHMQVYGVLNRYVLKDRSGKSALKKVFKFILKVIVPIVLGGMIMAELFGGFVIAEPTPILGASGASASAIGTYVSASTAAAMNYTIWNPLGLLAAGGGGGGGSATPPPESVLDPIEPPPEEDNPYKFELDPMKVKVKTVLTDPTLATLNSPKHADGFSNIDPYKEPGFNIDTFHEEMYKAQGGVMPVDQKKAPNGEYINKWQDGTWAYFNGNPYATTTYGDGWGAQAAYLDQEGVWRYNSGGTMPSTRTVTGNRGESLVITIGNDGKWRYDNGQVYEPPYQDN